MPLSSGSLAEMAEWRWLGSPARGHGTHPPSEALHRRRILRTALNVYSAMPYALATPRSPVKRNLLEVPLRRLRSFSSLTVDEEAAVRALSSNSLSLSAEEAINLSEGCLLLVVSGWACSLRVLADGRRQIFALILPGDVIYDPPKGRMRSSPTIRAVTAVQVVDATSLTAAGPDGRARFPAIQNALAEAQVLRESYLLDHIVRLGARTAYERVGHLLAEIFDRLSVVGLTNGDQFLMPFTQERLGEMLGLSETHVNRTLRLLRQDGLVNMGPGWFALPDRERMTRSIGSPVSACLQN